MMEVDSARILDGWTGRREASAPSAKQPSLHEDYLLRGDELGRGRYGVVRQCVQRTTGTVLACKSINKDALEVRA